MSTPEATRSQSVAAAQAQGLRLGALLRELELLLDLREAAVAGRLRLPLDELEQAGITPETLIKQPWPPALVDLLRQQHRRLRQQLRAALTEIKDKRQRAAVRGLIVWANLILRHSELAERALPRDWRPTRGSKLGDAWWAWRQARRG